MPDIRSQINNETSLKELPETPSHSSVICETGPSIIEDCVCVVLRILKTLKCFIINSDVVCPMNRFSSL